MCPAASTTDSPLDIHEIELKDIVISDANVRKHDIDRDLQELANSIKRHGQLQPIVLNGEFDKPPYEIIIGQRRFLAIRDVLNCTTIRATFAGKISKTEATIRSLSENMVRSDLSYEDTANAVTELYKHYKRDEYKVAKETGLSLQKIRRFIYIEEQASDKTKEKLRKGEVAPIDVQRALRAASGNIKKADELLELMKRHKLDKFQKARVVSLGISKPSAPAEEIIRLAKPPAIEKAFLIHLSDEGRKGLILASEKFHMNPDETASFAIEDWLTAKGFIG